MIIPKLSQPYCLAWVPPIVTGLSIEVAGHGYWGVVVIWSGCIMMWLRTGVHILKQRGTETQRLVSKVCCMSVWISVNQEHWGVTITHGPSMPSALRCAVSRFGGPWCKLWWHWSRDKQSKWPRRRSLGRTWWWFSTSRYQQNSSPTSAGSQSRWICNKTNPLTIFLSFFQPFSIPICLSFVIMWSTDINHRV